MGGDAWGPDLWVRLRMPAGAWRVSFFFRDWDAWNSATPREYRIALGGDGENACTARVSRFGKGVYKVFRVRGGRDIVLRIRKDWSINAILSGIFVDPLVPKVEPFAMPKATAEPDKHLADAAREWKAAAQSVNGFEREARALRKGRDALIAVSPDTAKRVLNQLGDKWFADGEYWRASLAYDTAPHGSTPLAEASEAEKRALQFRIVFPRHAALKIHRAMTLLGTLPQAERVRAMRALSKRVFDVALADLVASNHMVRLPMMLAQIAYKDLEAQVKYADLATTERAKMLAIAERLTWYGEGWNEVVNEAQRFWPTLNEKERALLGPAFFADHVVRPLGVLAQKDGSQTAKAAALVSEFVAKNSNTDAAAFAQYALAAIYYGQKQRDQASALCRDVMAQRPKSRPARLCEILLAKMEGKS